MRIHILGVPHTRTTREYSVCAFTQKTRLLCKMLYRRGFYVVHYGTEGSDPECSENVSVLDDWSYRSDHNYDWRKELFRTTRDCPSFRIFADNVKRELSLRCEPKDIVCCSFGLNHAPMVEGCRGIVIESGIGYDHTFAHFRVFESYAWMHYHFGKEGKILPDWYNIVIPGYIDMDDFPLQHGRENYHIFLGRPAPAAKGLRIAQDCCQELGIPLYVAGQGTLPASQYGEHLGVLSIEERAKWVGRAQALWCPSEYIEPFGTVNVEAAALATPVICTDWGAYPETVLHGITGYRCRTHKQFLHAARHTHCINPRDCRTQAMNYSLDNIAPKYERYFEILQDLHSAKGWYTR